MISTVLYVIGLLIMFLVTGIPDAMEYGTIPTANGAFFLAVGVLAAAAFIYVATELDRSGR